MVNGMERPGLDGVAGGASVYVLRDPRDGVIFYVGRTPARDGQPRDSIAGPVRQGATAESARAREQAICDAGLDVERVTIADLPGEAEAATVESAVVSAYAAARLAPSNLVAARGRVQPGSFADRPQGDDPFDHPDVMRFVARARAEIERLSLALGSAEQSLASATSAQFLDPDHRGRLERLVLQQEAEIAQLNEALDRVRALRDLGQWAAHTEGAANAVGMIRIDDLSRALG